MRIRWLCAGVPYPPFSGGVIRSYHLLRAVAIRHEVDLVALHQPALLSDASLDSSAVHLREFCRTVTLVRAPRGADRLFAAADWGLSFAQGLPYDVLALQNRLFRSAICALDASGPVDATYVDTVGLIPYVPASGVVILNHQNIESRLAADLAASCQGVEKLVRRYNSSRLAVFERAAALRANLNVTVSAIDAARLRQSVPEARVIVVPNGVDPDGFSAHPLPHGVAPTLLFAATLGWLPNHDAAMGLVTRIWPALQSDGVVRRLVLVGRRPRRHLADVVANTPGVELYPDVPDVRPFLHQCTVVVCPLRTGGGTRIKILEAWAVGRPVVASAKAAEGLEARSGAEFLQADSEGEAVAAIRLLERDPTLARMLADNGRRVAVNRYDWRLLGRSLADAFEAEACARV